MWKRLLCLLFIVTILGMCLRDNQAAAPVLGCPISSTPHQQQSQILAVQPMQFLPRTVEATTTEGGGQEQEVQPQQQPSCCGSILPLETSDSQRFIGPTLKSRYQRILGSQSLRFILSYIQCQGGTMSGTVTDILL